MSIIPSELSADELFRCNGEYVPVSEIARLTARIAELEKALRRSEKALKPFAARVYNDNGDMTISDMYRLTADDCIAAYFARKAARTTLEASERGGGE